AAGYGGGDFSDIADLASEVGRHQVDVVGEVLPSAGHAGDFGLAAQFAFRAHFARDPSDFRSQDIELIHHGVDCVLQVQDFALHVDRDLAGKIAARHGGGDVGDVADLPGQVRGHGVDVVGEVLPGAGHAADLRLASELAFRPDLARHPGH